MTDACGALSSAGGSAACSERTAPEVTFRTAHVANSPTRVTNQRCWQFDNTPALASRHPWVIETLAALHRYLNRRSRPITRIHLWIERLLGLSKRICGAQIINNLVTQSVTGNTGECSSGEYSINPMSPRIPHVANSPVASRRVTGGVFSCLSPLGIF